MGCEKDRIYYKPGECPKCGMDLTEPAAAHADHDPKHGGVLFMAPNKWHHVEGVLVSATECRLYPYNNYTKPISAAPFVDGSYVEVVRLDRDREETGKRVKRPFRASADGSHLEVSIPADMRVPIDFTVRLKFEGKERPSLFNFTFDKVSGFVK